MQPPKYTFDEVRLAELDSQAILDSPAESGFDDIVFLAAQICEAPVALVSLVAGDRQWFKARIGFEACETDLNSSVCAHALVEPDLLIIPDLANDPRTRENPLVTGAAGIRFYAGAPLRTAGGHAIGSLCVIDTRTRPNGLSDRQAESLRALARQVMIQLELRRTLLERDEAQVQRLAQENQRKASERQFRALFEAIEDGFCIIQMIFDGETPLDYRFIEINPAFVRQTGLTDATGRLMRELAPDHEQHWFDLYGRVALTGEPIRFENPAKQLGDRWYDVHAFRVGNPAERRVAILFNDVSQRKLVETQRLKAEADQTLLNQELSHRMKNSFAMVQAIAGQTLRRVADRGPVEHFMQRLHALSAAHDMLLQQSWVSAEIGGVVRAVLTLVPLDRFDISGPELELGPRATLSVSLLLHELTVNALKHGALSNESGRVEVTWHLQEGPGGTDLVLDWRETGGPVVQEPGRKGFGSRLIQMGLVGAGGSDLRYLPGGLEAQFKAELAQAQAH